MWDLHFPHVNVIKQLRISLNYTSQKTSKLRHVCLITFPKLISSNDPIFPF